MLDLIPIGAVAGNLTITFLALSYAGRLVVTAIADRDHFPDLPVVLSGTQREWAALAAPPTAAAPSAEPFATVVPGSDTVPPRR
ncbi:WS/DGAT domain-containing protein [Dactylosporangium darangshiense]|uniref:Uncharacterized protein n=1 Tax=Dactylosporangium darangshiense TaxID=579108 RepID=A0ABP8DV21_9ACTN